MEFVIIIGAGIAVAILIGFIFTRPAWKQTEPKTIETRMQPTEDETSRLTIIGWVGLVIAALWISFAWLNVTTTSNGYYNIGMLASQHTHFIFACTLIACSVSCLIGGSIRKLLKSVIYHSQSSIKGVKND
jgi:hypothetical protein